ncbi:MAG TPA: aspartate/glutamate racemase family protein [Streptosporangiaceae bacterium]|jgi:glutamate racemase|nr:aspartate/glutamate racemase family protein [Streptosporangiaceae bacterium]
MRIALINSGLGLLAPAAALHRMRPDADLVLAPDPDGMPWGPRTPDDIADRALRCGRAALRYEPDILVMACNTGSVHALDAMRAEFEPDVPVIGTVPAIKPAAAAYQKVAIWATVATTASAYQRRLIAEFAGSAHVTPVACPGLADAVDAGDLAATAAAVAAAATRTPAGCEAVVLGCTEYELVAGQIAEAVSGAVTFGTAAAVAAQALRRIPAASRVAGNGGGELRPGVTCDAAAALSAWPAGEAAGGRLGAVRVLLSGRPSGLPQQALRYPEGRLLAPLVVVGDEREPAAGPVAGR